MDGGYISRAHLWEEARVYHRRRWSRGGDAPHRECRFRDWKIAAKITNMRGPRWSPTTPQKSYFQLIKNVSLLWPYWKFPSGFQELPIVYREVQTKRSFTNSKLASSINTNFPNFSHTHTYGPKQSFFHNLLTRLIGKRVNMFLMYPHCGNAGVYLKFLTKLVKLYRKFNV